MKKNTYSEYTEYFLQNFEKQIGNKVFFINGAKSEICKTADGYILSEPDNNGNRFKIFFKISPLKKMELARSGYFSKFN